jgi:murein DD-endopeptidase MepM/ murein hydrolase activator NlpD
MPSRSLSSYRHSGRAGDTERFYALRERRLAGYTLAHGGRQFRLGPLAFWLVLGALALMAVWTVATATYFAFREDVLTRLIARQADMQFGYEDRIAELRAQVDRISSRQLLDQEQYEQKLDQLLRRQSALESRANSLSSGFGDVTSSIRPAPRTGASGGTGRPGKPSPINGKGAFLVPSDRDLSRDYRANIARNGGVSAAMAKLEASLDRVEQRQTATLNSIEEDYALRAQRIRGVLSDLGLGEGRTPNIDKARGMGGPFVAPHAPKDAAGFERQAYRVSVARIAFHQLARTLNSVPVRKPVVGEIDLVSSFGVRPDPFTGAPAMHTGLDIHGEVGDPVRATADGTVTAAGWSGGYGKSVDIDHGNGLSTRYGHLSSIDVQVGQSIKAGQIVGKVGSTGRSTGSHLHYETRVKGEAVDPQKFLRAGQRLGESL